MFFIKKDIKQFIKHSKLIFVVFALCEVTSLMLMIFSFGIYQNYSQQIKDISADEKIEDENEWMTFDYTSNIDSDNPVTYETVMGFLNELGAALGDKIGLVDFTCDGYYVCLTYDDGWDMYDISKNLKANGMWYSGRFIDKDDCEASANVCVAPIECYKELDDELGYDDSVSPDDYMYKAYDKDSRVYIDLPEGTFEVVGFTIDWSDSCYLPYTAFSSDSLVSDLPRVKLEQVLYQNEYNSAVNIFDKYFGDRISQEESSDMPVYDVEVLKTFKTKMTICVVIAIISSINITALFKFVIDLRRRSMAIFRVNGCSKSRLRRIMLGEMLIYSLVNILICLPTFKLLILPRLSQILPYISLAYSAKNYLILVLVYLAVTFISQEIMLNMSISRTPIQMIKNRR